MDRFVVVGDVEASRVVAQSTHRAVAASIGRPQPLVNRRTQVYLKSHICRLVDGTSMNEECVAVDAVDKVHFFGRRHISTSGFAATAP